MSLNKFHGRKYSQRWSRHILQTLINAHDLVSRTLDMLNELWEVSNGSRVQVVHDSKVSTLTNTAVEGFKLLLWNGGVCP